MPVPRCAALRRDGLPCGFTDEISAVSERGTGALREKVEALSEDEREMLREALAA